MSGHYLKVANKDGSSTWHCVIALPNDPATGKRRQKRLTAPTKKELESKVAEAVSQANRGTYVEPAKLTFGTFIMQWLDASAATVRPSTVRRYGSIIRHHILSEIGAIPLGKVSAIMIQDLLGRKQAAGYTPATVRLIFCVLHRSLGQAVKWRMLPASPADGVDVPRNVTPEITTWNEVTTRRFLETADTDIHAALWRTALTTGMRIGELLALTWADVDLGRGVFAVRRTLTRGRDGVWCVGEPKSASGKRQVKLPPSTVTALKQHKARQNERRLAAGATWQDLGVVFDRTDGTRFEPSFVYRAFRKLCASAGVPVIRLHDLRHTSATLLLAAGVHPKIVSERLGHSTVAMTLNRYSHVTMDMQETAADKMEAALG